MSQPDLRLNAILWQKTPSLNKSKGRLLLREMMLSIHTVCHWVYHFGTERRSNSWTAELRDPTHLVVPYVRMDFIRLQNKKLEASVFLFNTASLF